MKHPRLPVFVMASASLLAGLPLAGCAGPQPLSQAIDPGDDAAYIAMTGGGKVAPADAFLSEKAAAAGITVEEASRRDSAISETSNPFRARHDQRAVSRGAVIFKHDCVSCHGEGAAGDGAALPAPIPSMSFRRTALRWDITMRGGPGAKWFRTIREGTTARVKTSSGTSVVVQMPSFEKWLSRKQTWEVVTYLQSLECDAPEKHTP